MDTAKRAWRLVFLLGSQTNSSFAGNGIFMGKRLIATTSANNNSSSGFREQDPSFATKAIHAGHSPSRWPDSNPIVPHISLSTTFQQAAPGRFASCEYSRMGNPTRNVAEEVVASLEGGKHGLAFSSGMASITSVLNLLSPGDHIVTGKDLYGGTSGYLKQVADRMNIKTTYVRDVSDIANIENAMRENTKLVWMECPSNPRLNLIDIQKVAQVAHSREGILLAVDNTFMSPYFQRPLEFGADIVMNSATKYLNGHSDVLMGVLVTNDDGLHHRLRDIQTLVGAVPSPFECYLLMRGIKTLPVRMRQHMQNGLEVARFLENHPCVERVLHIGLPSHPQHELAKRQCYGHSGMVTFFIKGGREESSNFVSSLKVVALAESLGGCETLVKIPSIMPESYDVDIPYNLIRLSVGLEHVGDILPDLDQALRTAVRLP